MSKFYLGLTGSNYIIVALQATSAEAALRELKSKEKNGWMHLDWAETTDTAYVKADSIVVIKPYTRATRVGKEP